MLEKISQVAEQVATSVSRRQVLDRLGRAALAAAATAGGVLALSQVAHARAPGICGRRSDRACRGKAVGSLCGPRSRCIQPGGPKRPCTCWRMA
jgi:hypothetical protein